MSTEGTFSLAEMVRANAAVRPSDPAVTCEGRRLSWGDLHAASSRVANALVAGGVVRGDRVAMLARNCAEFYEVAFGVAKAGAILVGLNWRLAAPELAAILADARPGLVVADREHAGLVTGAVVLEDDYPAWRDGAPDDDPGYVVDPGSVAWMLYSSGTTGLPKGVCLSHANLGLSRRMAAEAFRMGPRSVYMVSSPQFHIGGAGTGLMAGFLGGHTVVVRDPQPAVLLETMAGERVTHAFLVPALIQTIVESPDLGAYDLSSVEQISYGAAPMSETLLRRSLAALGCDFLGVYGMTETAGTATVLWPEAHLPHLLRSVGQALPWMEVTVADLQTGGPVPPGTVGEVMVRSAGVTVGYWGQAEVTAAAITPEGWLHTGDGGYLDADGYLFLADRIKDMIISGGENVYPIEVENVLAGHPDVADVAVIGVPHERWGETVKAVVVVRPGTAPEPDALRAFARTQLAGYKCPTSVEFVETLPRNAGGKVLKRLLRDSFAPAG